MPSPVVEKEATGVPRGEDVKVVGVSPAGALLAHGELFKSLEAVFAVRFEPREPGELRGVDALLISGQGGEAPRLPCLLAPAPQGAPTPEGSGDTAVRFGSSGCVDRPLRRAVLHDDRAVGLRCPVARRGENVIAEGPAGPVWTARSSGRHRVHAVALSPFQPDSASPLRAQLREGRFLSLLPMIVFLREVVGEDGWSRPPLRASLVIDDPNLRRPRYGFIDFRALATNAADHRYHVSVATVPLDSWPVSRAASRVFASNPGSLSLAIHGNQHLRHELERFRSAAGAREQIDQALRRIAALERRSGVSIDRVMAAPHERCSPLATEAMLHAGFEALTIDRANPWRFRPEEEKVLAGWELAELVSGGLPVIRREHLSACRGDIVLRAFLDQPLVLYGHHDDLAGGPDRLAGVAREIDRLGDVRWMSLGAIARSNYLQRRDGSLLTVRMLCRRARIPLPQGVSEVAVEMPAVRGAAGGAVSLGGATGRWERDGVDLRSPAVRVGGEAVEIAITPPRTPASAAAARRGASAWPLVRRLIAEGRDRAQAIGRQAGRDAA
jgi:hypothetical protein